MSEENESFECKIAKWLNKYLQKQEARNGGQF